MDNLLSFLGYLRRVASGKRQLAANAAASRLVSARRDALVLVILIAAVSMLIWNGSTFFYDLRIAGTALGQEVRLASTALTLNVALILFGWRRYVDLQHEAEMRAEGERRAALLATTDPTTGLLNRKGFADRAAAMCGGRSAGRPARHRLGQDPPPEVRQRPARPRSRRPASQGACRKPQGCARRRGRHRPSRRG